MFALCHLAAPKLFALRERIRRAEGSFSGGLAVAYVFLHLLPEIDAGGELLGPRIYFVVLVGLATTAVFAVSIGLHLISTDFGMLERDTALFTTRGRFALVGAVALGYLLGLVREPHETYTDLLTALLAGFMMLNVFRKELPEFREARLRAFLLGMAVFVVAEVLLRERE